MPAGQTSPSAPRSLAGSSAPPAERVQRYERTVERLAREADRPRLLLAGGWPRALAIAARYADTVTFAWSPLTTEDGARSVVDRFAALAGERLGEIEFAANLVAAGDEAAPWLAKFTGVDATQLAAEGAMTVLAGTPQQGVGRLRRWREELGISYFTINSGFIDEFTPVVEELSGT